MRRDIRPVAEQLGITKRIGWHTFRHYSDLMTMPGEGERYAPKCIIEGFRRNLPNLYPA
jgi:hypothetical protein